MVRKMKISPEAVLNSFSTKKDSEPVLDIKITTSQLSDALKNLTGADGAIAGLNPINGLNIVGEIVTARTHSDDWGTVLNALDIAKKGDVLFLQSESDDKAIWGELASLSAKTKGLNGTVVYGAVRDVGAIKMMNYPVFARAVVPNAGKPLGEGQVNIPLRCRGVNVNPGDMIVGDECGVVVISHDLFPEAMHLAATIRNQEEKYITLLKKGRSLSELLGLD